MVKMVRVALMTVTVPLAAGRASASPPRLAAAFLARLIPGNADILQQPVVEFEQTVSLLLALQRLAGCREHPAKPGRDVLNSPIR